MRADTHDGPEQMLHVRGLIHCCSSHVRRSWNSVLQRTAGPYILALLRRRDIASAIPLTVKDRTCDGRSHKIEFDPLLTYTNAPKVPRPSQVTLNQISPIV